MKTWQKYLVTAAVGAALAFLVLCIEDVFSAADSRGVFAVLSDGFFVAGALVLGAGLITIASNGGTFDMLGYGTRTFLSTVGNAFRKEKTERKYKDFYEYREAKTKKKRGFAYLLVVGAAYIAVGVLFFILYYNA